jgi:hypothetical protein
MSGFFGEKMKTDPHFRPKLVASTLVGWIVMTLLLSASASFWEDILGLFLASRIGSASRQARRMWKPRAVLVSLNPRRG